MGLTDIFSIPFLICLAICILLVGCSSIYFYQRILQQDHKIASMVSLISSMAEERPNIVVGGTPHVLTQVPLTQFPIKETRITVSDDESDSDSDNESNSTDGDDSDYSADTDTEETDKKDIITINLGNSLVNLSEEENDVHFDLEFELDESEHDESEHDESEHDESEHDVEVADITALLNEALIDVENIHTINLGDTKTIHLNLLEEQPFEMTAVFKTNSDSVEDSKNNYKKMSIQKLRDLAQIQGHDDTSKLKKPEILKLLGVE